jgi:hypothetical protein
LRFCATHLRAHEWPNVETIETEVGHRGLTHPVAASGKPAGTPRSSVETPLAEVLAAWKQQYSSLLWLTHRFAKGCSPSKNRAPGESVIRKPGDAAAVIRRCDALPGKLFSSA